MIGTKAASECEKFEQFLEHAQPIITQEACRAHDTHPSLPYEDVEQAVRIRLWERRHDLYRVGSKERGNVWAYVRTTCRRAAQDAVAAEDRQTGVAHGIETTNIDTAVPPG